MVEATLSREFNHGGTEARSTICAVWLNESRGDERQDAKGAKVGERRKELKCIVSALLALARVLVGEGWVRVLADQKKWSTNHTNNTNKKGMDS